MINFIELWEETVGDSGEAPTDEELITFGSAVFKAGYDAGRAEVIEADEGFFIDWLGIRRA